MSFLKEFPLICFILCLIRLVSGDVQNDNGHIHRGTVGVEKLQEFDIDLLRRGDHMDEFPGSGKADYSLGRTERAVAQVANDTGYIYTEAIQDRKNPVYVELTSDQKTKINDFFGFVPRFEVIEEWDIRDINIAPGEYKAFNFTVWNQSHTISQYAILSFLSAAICTIPNVLQNATDFTDYLTIYSSYGDEVFGFDNFEDGYFQDQNYDTSAPLSTLFYIAARPIQDFTPNAIQSSDIFNLQVGFSITDVPFQWDNSTFAALVDADDDSALFQTGFFNVTSSNGTNETDSVMKRAKDLKLQVFRDTDDLSFSGLTKSFCAVQRAADDAVDETEVVQSFVNTNNSFRKRFFVNGLNSSTNYVAYVTSDVGSIDEPGIVYNKIALKTNEEGVCELAYDLDFCDKIAYSVPQSSKQKGSEALFETYDNYAKSLFENFTKAMDQINCDGDLETLFSPVRTCNDCKETYKNWLCGMVLPRCSTEKQDEYAYREVNQSRSDFLNEVIIPPKPYYEVMPCIGCCYAIIRDCPSDFGFGCPSGNDSITKSYQFWEDSDHLTCNLLGFESGQVTNSAHLSIMLTKSHYVWMMLTLLVLL